MNREWTHALVMAACLLVFAGAGSASPEVWATGTAGPSTDPGFEGYWKYCYEIHWTGLPHAVSHIEVLLCPPGDCACGCEAEQFAFADTVGHGGAEEGYFPVSYSGAIEPEGDPSTGLDGMLLKFEPHGMSVEPGLEGSAILCFYCLAAPAPGPYPDRISIKFGVEHTLGDLDGPLPGCRQGFSPTAAETWGHVKAIYR